MGWDDYDIAINVIKTLSLLSVSAGVHKAAILLDEHGLQMIFFFHILCLRTFAQSFVFCFCKKVIFTQIQPQSDHFFIRLLVLSSKKNEYGPLDLPYKKSFGRVTS